jgi:tRNA-2-methylthio-N6-dimethylallyladenosine synthase
MNRGYTRAQYIELINKLRNRVNDISITTDLIVGFPGETDDDFADTLSLVSEVGFDAAYTFAYSKRKLTKAANMPEQIDKPVKSKRLTELNAIVTETMQQRNRAYLGQIVEVLVDSVSKRASGDVVGRTRTAKSVNFCGDASDVGRLVHVRIDNILTHTLRGSRIE